jgi:hypothetical protein
MHLDHRLEARGLVRPPDATTPTRSRPSHLAGRVVFWALLLVALGTAADALQIPVVTATLGRLIAYLPRFVMAGVMVAIGVLVAGFVHNLVASRARTQAGTLLATSARVGIIIVSSFMAARELDIGASILNTAFVLVVGAGAAAFALAFGLGGRTVAGRVADDWYNRASASSRFRREPPEPLGPEIYNRPSAPH